MYNYKQLISILGNHHCTGTVNKADGTIDFEHGVNNCSMRESVNATHINYNQGSKSEAKTPRLGRLRLGKFFSAEVKGG